MKSASSRRATKVVGPVLRANWATSAMPDDIHINKSPSASIFSTRLPPFLLRGTNRRTASVMTRNTDILMNRRIRRWSLTLSKSLNLITEDQGACDMRAATGHLVPKGVIGTIELEQNFIDELLVPNTTFQTIRIEKNYLAKT